ncbi:MAG: complex I NDUFA9 subunit family protein [Desulfuromonadaceae bacterium]
MRVFLTGSTGFVGREILSQLLGAGHIVRCLVRPGSEKKLPQHPQIEIRFGDATDASSLDCALEECNAAIHLIGIIREFPNRGITFGKLHIETTRNLLDAARTQGVRRLLHMSANGTRANAVSPYHQSKWQAEEAVRSSTLDWTIFRPSLIFGAQSEFVTMLADLIRKLPVVPVFGDGRYRMNPVALEEVARSFVSALQRPETIGRIYHCGGAKSYSYDEVLDAFGRALGKGRVVKIHQPLCLMKPIVSLLESIPAFPITSCQLTMLLEGNECDPQPWSSAFDIEPTSLEEGLRQIFSN